MKCISLLLRAKEPPPACVVVGQTKNLRCVCRQKGRKVEKATTPKADSTRRDNWKEKSGNTKQKATTQETETQALSQVAVPVSDKRTHVHNIPRHKEKKVSLQQQKRQGTELESSKPLTVTHCEEGAWLEIHSEPCAVIEAHRNAPSWKVLVNTCAQPLHMHTDVCTRVSKAPLPLRTYTHTCLSSNVRPSAKHPFFFNERSSSEGILSRLRESPQRAFLYPYVGCADVSVRLKESDGCRDKERRGICR